MGLWERLVCSSHTQQTPFLENTYLQCKFKRGGDVISLVARPLPDFISPDFSSQLRDKIWEWPGDEARV